MSVDDRSSAFLKDREWFIRGDTHHKRKVGLDIRDEETISRLLARAFTEGRVYQAGLVAKALNPVFYTPWRS